jgi:hypothetical protein
MQCGRIDARKGHSLAELIADRIENTVEIQADYFLLPTCAAQPLLQPT